MAMLGIKKIANISNRKKGPMVTPGLCDADILPGGGSMSAGLSLDYRAIGSDAGRIPFNNNLDDDPDEDKNEESDEVVVEEDDEKDGESCEEDWEEENYVDDWYNDNNGARGSFVGSKESSGVLHRNIGCADDGLVAKAYPDYPAYSNPELYTSSIESPRADITPHFDLFNTYFADDGVNDVVETSEGKYTKKDFCDIGYEQRGMPETVMMRAQGIMGGGVLSVVIEHAGDIIHRANDSNTFDHGQAGYPFVKEKVDRVLRFLNRPYGFEKEYRENVKANAEVKGVAVEELQNKIDKALLNYAHEHEKLPELNESHRVMKKMCIAIGHQQFETAAALVAVLNSHLGSPSEWERYAHDGLIRTKEASLQKSAFIKTAIAYDSNPIIQQLIAIPQVRALIEQHASGYVDKITVTTTGSDVQQTQQQLQSDPTKKDIKLDPISGSPYGHMFTYQDPTTHQKKPLDRIVRIDRVTDLWGTLVTILHEISHHRHPEWSESQVESEAAQMAGTVKQYLQPKTASKKKVLFVKNNFSSMPIIEADVADTYQKQVMGLQGHDRLNPKAGMVFTYNSPSNLSFHMGTVKFPIDIIFANADNKILKIYRNCMPGSSEVYSCDRASKVIEVVASFCMFHDLDVGDQVYSADDDAYNQEEFTRMIFNRIKDIKLMQQKSLGMKDWNIKVVMKKNPDIRKFMKVDWTDDDYKAKKANILINPDPVLMQVWLKKMGLETMIRHAILHIMVGYKNELPEDKEFRLITKHL